MRVTTIKIEPPNSDNKKPSLKITTNVPERQLSNIVSTNNTPITEILDTNTPPTEPNTPEDINENILTNIQDDNDNNDDSKDESIKKSIKL